MVIIGFSVAVALADVKDDLMAQIRKKAGRARLRPVDPLAGRSVAETLSRTAMDDKETWVFYLVSEIAIPLKLNVKILVLQDSMGHYLVQFAQGKRLVSYRVDKAWVADAMAGKAEARERIHTAVAQYLRQEFLGQKIPPKAPPAPAKPTAPAAPAATPATPAQPAGAAVGGASSSGAAPAGQVPASPAAGAGQPEMSREENIAAAKARVEAIKNERAAGGSGGSPPAGPPPAPQNPA